MQVGDRLLTTDDGSGPTEWDTYANKSLLVYALGSRMIISYAGLAHINSVPTDQWIAETIIGEKMDRRPSMRFGQVKNFTLQTVLEDIEAAIRREFYKLPSHLVKNGLEILITGWSWRRRLRFEKGRPRTIAYVISAGPKGSKYKLDKDQRRFWYQQEAPSRLAHIWMIGNTFYGDKLSDAYNERRTLLTDKVTEVTVQELAVAHIRHVSTLPGGSNIGTDCMSIFLPIDQDARITYVRDAGRQNATLDSYTPWFIRFGGMVMPPSRMNSSAGTQFVMGPEGNEEKVDLLCEPPLPKPVGGSVFSSQARKRLMDHVTVTVRERP